MSKRLTTVFRNGLKILVGVEYQDTRTRPYRSLQTAIRRGDDLLLLTNENVKQVLTMADCVDVLRCFFEEEGKGQVLTRQRTESWLPHLTTDTFYQCKTMEGVVPYVGKYVLRIDPT